MVPFVAAFEIMSMPWHVITCCLRLSKRRDHTQWAVKCGVCAQVDFDQSYFFAPERDRARLKYEAKPNADAAM